MKILNILIIFMLSFVGLINSTPLPGKTEKILSALQGIKTGAETIESTLEVGSRIKQKLRRRKDKNNDNRRFLFITKTREKNKFMTLVPI